MCSVWWCWCGVGYSIGDGVGCDDSFGDDHVHCVLPNPMHSILLFLQWWYQHFIVLLLRTHWIPDVIAGFFAAFFAKYVGDSVAYYFDKQPKLPHQHDEEFVELVVKN